MTSAKSQATVTPSPDCATAPDMILPDTVLPYCSALTEGMTFQGEFKLDSIAGDNECFTKYYKGNAWYKFKVPQGKGIKGFLLDVPLNPGCSTCVDDPFDVNIYKGTDCNNLEYKGQHVLHYCVTADLRGFYENPPIHFDSAKDNETYYLNFYTNEIAGNKTINPGIKWLPDPVSNTDCSNSQMLTSAVTETCNRIIPVTTELKNYIGDCDPINHVEENIIHNPVYYSFVPKSSSISFTIKSINCLGYPRLWAFVYKDCAHIGVHDYLYGCITNHYDTQSDSVILQLNNLPVDSTLILVIDPQQVAPGIDFIPTEAGTCTFKIISDGILLPLQALQLNGNYNIPSKKTILTWASFSTKDVLFYIVERSANGKDFVFAEKVISQFSNQHSFSFTDERVTSNQTYYRLKQMNINGKFTYSNTICIKVPYKASIQLYPNPAKDWLTVELDEHSKTIKTLQVTDMAGRILIQRIGTFDPVSSPLQINISSLAKGSYLLVVRGERMDISKFIVE